MNEEKKLNILLVDDNSLHRDAGRQLLVPQYNVDIVGAFDFAMDKLNEKQYDIFQKQYDVLLTDLLFPQGRGDMMGKEGKYLKNEELAFGFPLALIAAGKGVPKIAIVTDMNHHQHPMAYTFDFLNEGTHQLRKFSIEDSECMMFGDLSPVYLLQDGSFTTESPYMLSDDQTGKYVQLGERGFKTAKNWKAALDILLGGKE